MDNPRTPLIGKITDDVQVRGKHRILSAYASGKIFSGVTLPDNTDVQKYVTPGVVRISVVKNGPPVNSPGYLVTHTINPDEEIYSTGLRGKLRIRHIYYPDSITESTPYTCVGVGDTTANLIWSNWTTLGGNWISTVMIGNTNGIPNFMYNSFGNWTLTLPNPTDYVFGTRIGLTQWLGKGKVVYSTTEQTTESDLVDDGSGNMVTIGALQYIMQIVPDSNGNKRWSLEVDNNISGTIQKLTERFQADINDIRDDINALEDSDVEINARIDKEIADRTKAVADEAAARIAADNAEATARANADTAEATARANADNTERSERIAADNAEATTRADADTALTGLINTERSDRIAAVSAEATARANADTALDSKLTGLINTERSERVAADNAEATARANADTAVRNDLTALINTKQRMMKYAQGVTSITIGTTGSGEPPSACNLNSFDYTVMVSVGGGKVTLPAATSVPLGARVLILISPNISTTVADNLTSEVFSNTGNAEVLVVDMLVAQSGATTKMWTLLSIG